MGLWVAPARLASCRRLPCTVSVSTCVRCQSKSAGGCGVDWVKVNARGRAEVEAVVGLFRRQALSLAARSSTHSACEAFDSLGSPP